ncbi:MAG: 1-acyl-sn-glycerol-3-phosphate acyltransferase, partial [Rickettsiales bacterium]|nr:1-acyl-sn-glycerol-3-phosphate acyltransferase [Rickettsiales bacterium]
MKDKTFKYIAFALKIAEKILGSKFSISGTENIPPKPVLFVCNHFTRSETFFVPYLIHKYTKRQVRCLADSGLFKGNLGKFLNSVGSISTKDQKRDEIILSDLINGSFDWLIYPEGGMIKSKEIKMNGFGALSK